MSATGSTPCILVVDDNDASRYATMRTLRASGFLTLEAATGGEALSAADGSVDLVVLDVNLPDIDGFQVCRELRARRATADLPVIYLSATFTNSADRELGMQVGADSYLTHPADPVALVATVRALLFARDAHSTRRAANMRFRTIFDSAPNGMALLDRELRIIDSNTALCDLLGLERRIVLQRPLATLVDSQQEATLNALQVAVREQRNWEGVLRLTRPQGATELEWTVTPDPDGAQFIAMIVDVTERRLSETRQARTLASERAARAEAELSNQLKDQFLATLSHELRNPLGAILGWSSVLKRTPDLKPALLQGIDAIERNARVQSHLISDLLDFAGIRFGKMRLEIESLEAADVVRAAVDTVSHQAEKKGIRLELALDEAPAPVQGDPARLQQIVWNLLTNAIKFTPASGRVRVTGRRVGDRYCISVADSGLGISPEFLPQLFDRFSQQDATKAKSFAGLGIGLSIVRHLVELHGGTIDVTSDGPGLGATFTVHLPIASSTDVATPQEQRDLRGVQVLIVEDGDDTRALIRRLVSDAGASVSEASNAEEALESIEASRPDVLVSDIGMAKTDGYALIRAIRERNIGPDVLPAIALTAFVRSEDREDALAAGFQMHLGKPVNSSSLIAAIARLALTKVELRPTR